MSILVGTVSADGTPAACRATAVRADDDLATLTVYVAVATSQETVANVAATRRIAVVCSRPLTHSTIQIKGPVRQVRLAGDDEREFLAERHAAFATELADLGFPKNAVGAVAHWPSFAIELAIEEIFEQTPGPAAGVPLR